MIGNAARDDVSESGSNRCWRRTVLFKIVFNHERLLCEQIKQSIKLLLFCDVDQVQRPQLVKPVGWTTGRHTRRRHIVRHLRYYNTTMNTVEMRLTAHRYQSHLAASALRALLYPSVHAIPARLRQPNAPMPQTSDTFCVLCTVRTLASSSRAAESQQ